MRLRDYLVSGQPDSALQLLDPAPRQTPGDPLLLDLQRAVILHQAGRYAESNQALERAELEIDQRYTRSLSRAAGSLLVNDGVLEYLPPLPERAMIPYYRMLNHWALGESNGAVVEARKAAALIGRLDSGKGKECRESGFLDYLSGLTFAAGGERNDALVSFRRADRTYTACSGPGDTAVPPSLGTDLIRAARALGFREVADTAAKRYRVTDISDVPGTGELIVLVEHGFVAHRVHRDIHVPIFPEELKALGAEDGDSVTAAVGRVSTRLIGNLLEQAEWGSAHDETPMMQWANAAEGAYVVKLAWPAYRLDARRAAAVRVSAAGRLADASPAEDLSAGMVRAWDAQRSLMLARTVARGLTKFQLTQAAEKKADKQGGETAAWIVGRLANAAGNVMERADTRGWTLLPDQVSVARLTLPSGPQRIRLETLGPGGEVTGELDLGTVEIRPGQRIFLSRRVWGTEAGNRDRLGSRDRPRVATSRCAGSETSPSGSAPAESSKCQ